VGLGADGYHRGIGSEEFFFWTAVVLLLVSIILAITICVGITTRAVFVGQGVSADKFQISKLIPTQY